jgi:galactarate dehydratase
MYIRVNPSDNVAILVHPDGVAPGALLPDGLVAREAIPQSHKIALHHLEAGQPVVRYGQTIGLANRAIAAGSWVREELLDMPAAPPLDSLSLATAVPPTLPPLENYTFEGYRNADGATGTRNLLGLATTVQCVAPTVEYAAQRIRAEILPRFPNVDGVVAITHSYGCGVAIDAPGAVSSRTALAEKWRDLIDLDAGRIATGHATIEDVGWELFRLILDVASGRRQTWAEHWGLANALAPFNPGPVT